MTRVQVGVKGPKGLMLWALEGKDGEPELQVEDLPIDEQLRERYRDFWPTLVSRYWERMQQQNHGAHAQQQTACATSCASDYVSHRP